MLHNVIEMAWAMNDTVYFDDVSPYNIEDEIGFDDEHPVADCPELFMFRDMSEAGVY